jgi:hypothetical protein
MLDHIGLVLVIALRPQIGLVLVIALRPQAFTQAY